MHLNSILSTERAISFFPSFSRKSGKILILFSSHYVYGPSHLLLIILLSLELAKVLDGGKKPCLRSALSRCYFHFIYFLILLTGKPSVLFQTELFSPYRFSLNKAIPSLGHLLLLSILAVLFQMFFTDISPLRIRQDSKKCKKLFFL